jgi:glycosyltransferase involved in cell wall biosynthesis
MVADQQPALPITVQMVHYSNPDLIPPIINEVRVLAEAGAWIDVLCRDYGGTWNISYPTSTRIVRMPRGDTWSNMREYLAFVGKVIRLSNPMASIVIGHDMHGFVAARFAAWLRRRPLIYQCHDYVQADMANTFGLRIVKRLEALLARTADAVIVPDADRAEIVARELRLRRPPIILPNAPLSAAVPATSPLRAALEDMGYSFERVLLRQGRIGPGHAIEATLCSMPHWSNSSWGFVLIGDGPEEYQRQYRQLAADLGVETRFVILPPVGYDEILGYTVGADAGSALYEPIHVNNRHITTASNKLMEYLACGLPMILSDTPAMQRFLACYACGVTADEGDPRGIAQAVNVLLGDEAAASRMAEAAREAFLTTFAYEIQVKVLVDLLRRLTASHFGWQTDCQ